MALYLIGFILLGVAALIWLIPHRWWLWLDATYQRGKLLAFLRGFPAFVIAYWLLFAAFFPIDEALGGNRPGQSMTVAEAAALIVCLAICLVPMVTGRPRILTPPGARKLY